MRSDWSCPTNPIPKRVPEPFLRAEVAAFPIASPESFLAGLVELDPGFPDNSKTSKLWRACESQLAPHTGWSLDRLVAARDRGWFGDDPGRCRKPVPMHVYLRALASSHLMRRAGVTEIVQGTDFAAMDAADHYRWLTFTLPEDLLLCALGVDPAPVRVDLEPPLLVRRLLDLGVAEIHQHIGAGMDFPLLWASVLAAVATTEVAEDALASPGAPLSEGKSLVRWLIAGAVARCVLAEFLIQGGNDFRRFVNSNFLGPGLSSWTVHRRETLASLLTALVQADEKELPDIQSLRNLYADIHPTALTLKDYPLQDILDAFRRCDPIAVRLDLHGRNAGERWLLRKAYSYLEKEKGGSRGMSRYQPPHDHYFALVFWQTVRVRCQYYRTVVQRPLTSGLQWFVRFSSRLGPLRNPLTPIRPQIAYSVAGEGHRIRALEFRSSLWGSSRDIGKEMLDFLQSWQRVLKENAGAMFEPEMGVIALFAKERDGAKKGKGWFKGTPRPFWGGTNADPCQAEWGDVVRGRYAEYFIQQCKLAQALCEVIEAVPSMLWVIRGLDMASDEISVPTWVLAPLFRHIVDVSARVSIREQEDAGPPLNITAHVGEDFRHLMEGMRRVYEQVQYVLGGTKGRLGHAIALGVDPQSWAESVGSILMPAEERLWDLVWEWRLYTRYRIFHEFNAATPAGRVGSLVNKIHELADHIYGKVYQVEELAEAHHVLHCFLSPPFSDTLPLEARYHALLHERDGMNWNKPGLHVHAPDKVRKILCAYLTDESIFKRGQRLIDIPIRSDEIEALTAVQNALRLGIAHRGIVVEINPSSNLLIGDLLDLRNHPIIRLNPPVREEGSQPPVAIALGSDDPLTFISDLLREYTLLYHAACSAGYPERVAQEWMESIRRTGMDARFTKSWRPSAKEKVEKLLTDIRRYLHEPPPVEP